MRLTGVILIGLAVVTLGILGCRATEQEKVAKDDVIVRELAAKHGAITGWEENLTYTIQAQDRLVTGKPILFRGFVDDIFRRNDKVFVRFWSSLYVFELECSRSIVDVILTQQADGGRFFDEYAVVANIEEVSKPVIALRASALSEHEAEIDIDTSGLFMAGGTCIDIAYIPYSR
jgi:hypothetical protein